MAITTWVSKGKVKFVEDAVEKTRTWSDVEGDVETIRHRTIIRNGGAEVEEVEVRPIKSKNTLK